jgi:hypothetical protein
VVSLRRRGGFIFALDPFRGAFHTLRRFNQPTLNERSDCMKKFYTAICGVCVLTLLLGITPYLRAADSAEPPKKDEKKEEKVPRNPRVDGLIIAIDAEKKTITVEVKKDEKMTIAIGADVRLRKGDAEIKFGDLAVGNFVQFSYRMENEKPVVRSMIVHDKQPFDHDGTVVSINKESSSIEVQTGVRAKNVYHCGDKTQIMKEGKPIALSDIAAGNYVKIRFTKEGEDKKNAVRITVFDKKPEKAKDEEDAKDMPKDGEKN